VDRLDYGLEGDLLIVATCSETCSDKSHADLSAARERKQEKPEYLQIVAELV